ncbi:lysine N(6)-hydroxylase/L-ornithine N(5)-oxygenase family protein [Salinactinospora qingdaonensis]|uniref:lysine N(6)-hydroxylase/L-ornithine N(5)-oxygenase family protein n=1 Tax=Salinactinospora qingdaonensis TaxID=702744 RepID=UPI003CD099D0
MTSTPHNPPVYDLVGVGFGPSNVALAIALQEARDHAAGTTAATLSGVFLERQAEFGWHRGMLLNDATMQVSFLKDLVTTRDPASDFSFLAYLHQVGRLHDFINHKTLFPLRTEFHDYLAWCASRVEGQVRYSHEVTSVEPVRDAAGRVALLDVVARDAAGALTRHRARNVVLAPGLLPHLPGGRTESARVWHSEHLLHRIAALEPAAEPRSFVVVGAGQSAAEAAAHLYDRFPDAEINTVFARYGYSPSDDSSFANRIFDPEAVDAFFTAPEDVKTEILEYHRNTNYSVVDPDLIEELYRKHYADRVRGVERLRQHNTSRVAAVEEHDSGVTVTVEDLTSGKQTPLYADHVIYATGYRPADPRDLLGELAQRCLTDTAGRPVIQRDYRMATTDEVTCGIYSQGGTEHTHGLSATLLSNVAVRVGEILDSISARTAPVSDAPAASHVAAPH